MKIYFLIISLLAGFALSAQTYHPFPTKNTIWSEMYYYPYPNDHSEYHCFGLKDNDTIINNKLYHKLYHSADTIFTEDKLCGGLREENKKVYYYSIEPIRFSTVYKYTDIPKDTEVLLYDFSFKVGDTIKNYGPDRGHPLVRLTDFSFLVIVSKIDSILIGDSYRKRFRFSNMTTENILPYNSWIEGIGLSRGLLYSLGNLPNNGLWNDMVCFKQGNDILHHCNEWCYNQYNDCYYIQTSAQEIKTIGNIKIYPNPVSDELFIQTNSNINETYTHEMYSVNGELIKTECLESGSNPHRIDVSSLRNGIYILRLISASGKYNEETIIKE